MARIAAALAASCRALLVPVLAIATRAFWQMEFHGLQHDTRAPSTYLAITHKRDEDAMGPAPWLLLHRGWRAVTREVHFAMRGDSLTPGFLARVVARPRWLAWLLRPFSVGPILRALGFHPLLDLHLRPGEEWLRDELAAHGDATAGATLAPAFLAALATAGREPVEHVARLPLARLLAWRYQRVTRLWWTSEIFLPARRREAELRMVARAKRALDDIAGWLRAGGSLLSAPEGRLSPHGMLGPISGGFHRIIAAAPDDARVLPIAIVYDSLTTGRPRMFVDVAPAIANAPTLPRAALDTALRQAWLSAARFTCTQLASGELVRAAQTPDIAFTSGDLAGAVSARAAALAAQGRHVDRRLLHLRTARRLVARYLRATARHGLVRRAGRASGAGAWLVLPAALASLESLGTAIRPGETGYGPFPLAYAWNELREMLGASAPDVASAAHEEPFASV